jgi:AraC family chitin signaling transcriptional activator
VISSILNKEEYDTGKMVEDDQGNLWFMTKNKMHYFTKDVFTNKLIHQSFYLDRKDRKSISGFEHIAPINRTNYLIGSSEGYIAVNLEKVKKIKPQVKIDAITTKDSSRVSLKTTLSVKNKNNNLLIEYSANTYQKYYPVNFQYKLEGNQEIWSSWSEQAFVKFENLNAGTYVFKVRARVRDEISETQKTEEISILPPWYWSNTANTAYVFSFFLFVGLLRGYYGWKNRKEQLKIIKKNNQKAELLELENQKELIRIRNEQLQNDIQSKNRELAIATMSTLKRNEFLNKIKKDLADMEALPKVEQLIKKINKNLKKNDDWEFFEDAFNNADKGFFKELKAKHPKLTNNDLRLCAFLRLNLSSKEIAPLLNISVHSVEIKRYRLRKKMNLSRDQRIVDYVMTL